MIEKSFETLLEEYCTLVAENRFLKEEIDRLKAMLHAINHPYDGDNLLPLESFVLNSVDNIQQSALIYDISQQEKIQLFMSLFRGRDDVYAKRWENKNGKVGYVPVCRNEWKSGVCRKPAVKCFDCLHKAYDVLNEKVIEDHLRGNIIIGIYPLGSDETCHFLAMDFDDDGWQKDIAALRDVCANADVPIAIERSRSGNGAHAWFFFDAPVPAAIARKFGSALITCSMNKNHEISFKSYDRFFPNQDTMPKGGFGNLIALPLQKKAREHGNSVFIDENFEPYGNQWGFLSAVQKLSEESIVSRAARLSGPDELGALKKDEEETEKPWEPKPRIGLTAHDFPKTMVLVKANMIYIPKADISQSGLNALKRLAAFKNPDFYKAQAMRLPTYNKPRIISCSDEKAEYLCLPRGCATDVATILDEAGVALSWSDQTQEGKCINVEFNGMLREDQRCAAQEMLKHENGVLAATTAFGKTVIAAKLIAQRKVSTLIIVHRQQLLT